MSNHSYFTNEHTLRKVKQFAGLCIFQLEVLLLPKMLSLLYVLYFSSCFITKIGQQNPVTTSNPDVFPLDLVNSFPGACCIHFLNNFSSAIIFSQSWRKRPHSCDSKLRVKILPSTSPSDYSEFCVR